MSVSSPHIPKDTDYETDFQSLSTEIKFYNFIYRGGKKMANIKSAKKRILVNQTKYERNKGVKSAVKTSIKKVEAAVAANDKVAAEAALKAATKAITMAGSKGIYHKNNVARKVSRLTKLVNTIA